MLTRDIGIVSQFSPRTVGNLRAWYGDYVNGGTLRTTLANGANVNSWDDLSGNAFHMDSKVNQPVYNSSGNYIAFTTDMLYNTSHSVLSGNEARTVILVACTDNNSTDYDFLQIGKYVTADSWLMNGNGANVYLQVYSTYSRIIPTPVNGTKYIYTTAHPATGNAVTNLTMRWNGNGGLAQTTSGTLTANTSTGIFIGGYYDSSTHARGSLRGYEIIVYNRLLNTGEIWQVEQWLKNKYSII